MKQDFKSIQLINKTIQLILPLFLFSSCSKLNEFDLNSTDIASNEDTLNVVTPDENDSTQNQTPYYKPVEAIAWEKVRKTDGTLWSEHSMKVILDEEASTFLAGAEDMNLFCPSFYSLSNQERATVWTQIISGISYYESGYNPTSRYVETTMGIDPITGQQVVSEGLLQLSYQDITGWKFCEFDWNKDKNLSAKDPRKTILDPYKNLRCGIKIMASQLRKKKRITLSSGVYWAVLKNNGKYQKIDQIASISKGLKICQSP